MCPTYLTVAVILALLTAVGHAIWVLAARIWARLQQHVESPAEQAPLRWVKKLARVAAVR